MYFTDPDLALIIVLTSAVLALICFCLCMILSFKLRALAKRNTLLEQTLEERIAGANQDLKTTAKRIDEYARRIAWVETRIRPGTPPPEPTVDESLAAAAKPSLTERRHRVLSLARKGIDVNTIATMLGSPHGEIELIIGLNKTV